MDNDNYCADVSVNCFDGGSSWSGFTYLKDNTGHDRTISESPESLVVVGKPSTPGAFALSEAKVGDRLYIVALNCAGGNTRLMGMGLMPGVELNVISSTTSGSVIIALGDHRLGLGADMAENIQVATENLTQSKRKLSSMNKTNVVQLRHAAIGSRLRVVGYDSGAGSYKRKLLAMGLTPGVEFTVKRHAPLGDPTQIEVRGFNLSLRKDEADALQVALIDPS
ncbi:MULTISPECIES: ferrous iron transport protein A [Arthrospira]|jgi:ferrous iron transport protein A|uniref:Ferrous iron transport protein A n=1 Tax=Limnospira platensis NIES-46 TaxID=1236695 RepID=A0A5M3TE54_LIMPL|nr:MULTISPECIES: FeoA family protein [Arthrospira]AMW29164.1 iron transporter FeoA [Arthrospira platensis YZ]KDR57312.1 iron transporter FeoA [Arthrospira platensis str. Paraca]MBD2669207.1 ferrous iron transport protein A [Arthrospira platensis FACHB-439]MBD2711306.1 ferrous iron transport protein A [Arthrospira platensis FACHB-835]MDF2213020.1 FeoA family protein [Arthrospira platensis NCB002]MDT9181894.1 FeoA family protein [Limnospira sp. PMC 289.06]MDT9295728.1 FeoA family protein [Arth